MTARTLTMQRAAMAEALAIAAAGNHVDFVAPDGFRFSISAHMFSEYVSDATRGFVRDLGAHREAAAWDLVQHAEKFCRDRGPRMRTCSGPERSRPEGGGR